MLLTAIGWLSLTMSGVSFAAFIWLSVRPRPEPRPPEPHVSLEAGLSDIEKLVTALAKMAEAIAKMTDSFAKAGPAISALVASFVFLGFAVIVATLRP